MGVRPIRLVKDWSIYTTGQVLTPPGGFAQTLIDRGLAEDYQPPADKPEPTLQQIAVTRRRGWPKGKPRKPRAQRI